MWSYEHKWSFVNLFNKYSLRHLLCVGDATERKDDEVPNLIQFIFSRDNSDKVNKTDNLK